MKTKLELLSALMVAALLASGSVMAQSIPVPASSADSGRRAVVAVTQPNMSNYATKTELNNAYNLANTANNTANTAQYYGYNAYTNQGGSFGAPWARQFPGQSKFAYENSGASQFVYIDGNGYLSSKAHGPQSGYPWVGMGFTSGSACLTVDWGKVCPASFDYYGRATDWTVTIFYVGPAENAGPGNGSY